ncbi:hypothetical protein N7536_005102 [Penicillium majusculum]|nr:hypothetical protein N7536_005102 [Penicillium majusculum]
MGHRKIRYVSQPAARIQIHRSFGPYINANRESENCVQQFSAGQKMAGGSGRARAALGQFGPIGGIAGASRTLHSPMHIAARQDLNGCSR